MPLRSDCVKRVVSSTTFAVLLASAAIVAGCQQRGPLDFRITMPKARHAAAADGRLLLLFSKDPRREPRLAIDNEFQVAKVSSTTTQVFGMNVDGWAPDAAMTFDRAALGFPLEAFGEIPPGEYNVQAVLHIYETFHRKDGHVVKLPMDRWSGQRWSTNPGNLYSEPRKIWIDPAAGGTIALSLDREIPPKPYPQDTKYVKYVRL